MRRGRRSVGIAEKASIFIIFISFTSLLSLPSLSYPSVSSRSKLISTKDTVGERGAKEKAKEREI